MTVNPPYYPQPQQYQPYVAPSQVPQVPVVRYPPQPAPAPVPAPQYNVPVVRSPAPVPAPVPQMQQPMYQAMQQGYQQDWYGRLQDPLHFTLLAAPPPFRPQMEGETFFERFVKNVMLDLGALFASHMQLALRQMILPPQPPKPQEKVING